MAKIRYKKVCEYCGVEFETTIKHKKYCSYICADFRNRELVRNRKVVAIKEGLECERIIVRKCLYCRKEFEVTDGRQKYCSEKCKKLRQAKYHAQYMYNKRHGNEHSIKDMDTYIRPSNITNAVYKRKLKTLDKKEELEDNKLKEIKIFFDDVWARIGAEKPKEWEYGKLKR